jgi:hypothetical protein
MVNPFYLLLVLLSVLAALWLTFRLRSSEPRWRFPAIIVGLAIAGLALYQGLHGQSPFTPGLETLATPVTSILPEAVRFLLIIVVASMGVLILSIGSLAAKEGIGVVRTRGPTILRYVLCVGAYFYVSLLPMGLVKSDLLHFTDQTVQEIAIAYVSLITALIFVATVLALHKEVRDHKVIVIGFFLGCVAVAASSPFVWTLLATAIPAAQPIGALSIFAMVAPAPAYFLLHYRLGWL